MTDSIAAEAPTGPMQRAWLALGFRPFYLVAALFAVIALPLWLAVYAGGFQFGSHLGGVYWHSHEMVFGYTTAVMAGFLLTAVRNWTGQPTPVAGLLALLVLLWLFGRTLMLAGPATLAMAVDLAFLPVLAVAIAVPMRRSRNARHYKLLLVLVGLAACNLLFHLAHMGVVPGVWLRSSTIAALDLIALLMAIIGGRVIPAFTANAVPGASPRRHAILEFVAIAALVGVLVVGIAEVWMDVPQRIWTALLATAALAHALRWLLWQPHRTLGNALLWMLPVAYAWIPVSLALRALAMQGALPSAAAVHALTLGAVGGLTLAMMMRSSLGHTGRPLRAGKAEVAAFALVQLAGIARVAGTVVEPGLYGTTVVVSGGLWSLAFAVFLLRYAPMLTRPRVDGRAG